MLEKEPTYVFKPGFGWVPTFTGRILTPEDCVGEWINLGPYNVYHYPKICATYEYFKGMEHTDFKVGDVIPYGYNLRVIKEITSNDKNLARLIVDYLSDSGVGNRFDQVFSANGHYQGVVRPR